jgi:hypothetical protein
VACLLKARIGEPAEMAIARKRLCKCHVSVATVAHATMEVPLQTMFSMWSALTATSLNYKVTMRRSVFCGVHPKAI